MRFARESCAFRRRKRIRNNETRDLRERLEFRWIVVCKTTYGSSAVRMGEEAFNHCGGLAVNLFSATVLSECLTARPSLFLRTLSLNSKIYRHRSLSLSLSLSLSRSLSLSLSLTLYRKLFIEDSLCLSVSVSLYLSHTHTHTHTHTLIQLRYVFVCKVFL